MADFRVTCINKDPRLDTHESIKRLGGLNPDGTTWSQTKDQVISYIDSHPADRLYTSVGGKVSLVRVVRDPGKAPYLRTHADGYYNNNLLSLVECVN